MAARGGLELALFDASKEHVGSMRIRLVDLPRSSKRALLMCSDFVLLSLSIWLSFSLRWWRLYWPEHWRLAVVLLAAPLSAIFLLHCFRIYRLATRYIRSRDFLQIGLALGTSVLVWSLLVFMVVGTGDPRYVVPRSVVLVYGILAVASIGGSRWLAAWVLNGVPLPSATSRERRPVVIYGADTLGIQLLEALRDSLSYEPIGFIDDTPSLIGQRIGGLKVYKVTKLARLIERDQIREVLLALPAHRRRERLDIVRRLSGYPVPVKTLPLMEDIATGRVAVTDLRTIDVQDLLGREPVPPDEELLDRAVRNKVVMVTGAGGSIGSELARQILLQSPRRLVLYDISEVALYDIETEILDLLEKRTRLGATAAVPEVVAVLGSILDENLLSRAIELHGVEVIYHAAAYKHVPIVEANAVVALRNNTLGAVVVARVASRYGVARVMLISTDKAVRPTSIMGASKRLAELVFQAHAAEPEGRTIFTMVRFGNVLDSSGSVVRRFRKQIERGGPVTVTDPDVTRYFMLIPEAAGLVLQASAMAQGGEVFVLDMGEPIRIDDLARTMIKQMGRDVRDSSNPDGEIEIHYTGLRPGEKLFEELRIDDRTTPTEHPHIRRTNEPFLDKTELDRELSTLQDAMTSGRLDVIQAVLARTVEGYQPNTQQAGDGTGRAWPAVSRMLH